mmetsp:Transcript_21790/g.51144  ORF Transcript_21790/g.51144 Transcript_21790/m.51144 type:complete len:213 (+) Transcript_21790:257-895(+)
MKYHALSAVLANLWRRATITLLSMLGGHECVPGFFDLFNEHVDGLRKEFTSNRHVDFVEWVFADAFRKQYVNLFENRINVDRHAGFRRNDEFDARQGLQAVQFHSPRNNSLDTIIGATGIFSIRRLDGRRFGRNGVERMKGRSNAQPFVGTNFGSLGRQGTMMNQTSTLVDDEQVQECHDDVCCGWIGRWAIWRCSRDPPGWFPSVSAPRKR